MKPIIRPGLLALVVMGLAGCGSTKPIKYYAIQVPTAPVPTSSTYPIDLVVGRMTGPALLEAAPIVYRTGANPKGTYQYHRWEDAPVDLVPEKLVRLLRSTGEYRSVVRTGGVADSPYLIRGRLLQFEEVDGGGISGQVTMEFELYDRRAGKLLWSHFYSQTEPVENKEITSVVQAIDRNLERGLKEVVAGLGQYFAANPPKKS